MSFKPRAALLLLLLCLLLFAAPAYAEGGFSAGPHREGNVGPGVDSSGTDAVVPIWDAPPTTLIKFAFEVTLITICAGCLAPVIGRIQDVLSHDKRKSIYDFICRNPGCAVADISVGLSINIGTVYHHLWMLELRHKVFFESHGKFARVYDGCLASSEKSMDRTVCAHVRNEMSRRLLNAILRNPGISNGTLSQDVGLDKSTVCWYLQKFMKDELVVTVREGRHKHCFINDEAKLALEKRVDD